MLEQTRAVLVKSSFNLKIISLSSNSVIFETMTKRVSVVSSRPGSAAVKYSWFDEPLRQSLLSADGLQVAHSSCLDNANDTRVLSKISYRLIMCIGIISKCENTCIIKISLKFNNEYWMFQPEVYI